ncbi:hypothetical protein [Trichocoleus sp. FACHB-262]|uniref:hypothetical protein n=1 Tax=Trichocoleus sp. FACHB-262 TaxID=2692869 RepID=UPI0016845AC4|nr:hypothetical protein [Trichocoleus sp. FACHB-262]MBD2123964.1 hypothetical protein [Trichocoleus sp. FACHB-262]
MASCAIGLPSLAENRDLSKPVEKTSHSPLHSNGRVTATSCGDLISGTVQLPAPGMPTGTEVQGAKSTIYSDRIRRGAFLADDGQFTWCHHDSCCVARGVT